MDRYPPPFGCRSTALQGLTSLLASKIGTANSELAIQVLTPTKIGFRLI